MSEDWRPLRLRRDGTCTGCGAHLPAGSSALWSRSIGAVRCRSHTTCPPASDDVDVSTHAPTWTTVTLRRSAACETCGAPLAAGTTAEWNPQRRVTRCASHDDGAAAGPPPSGPPLPAPRATGRAGGSAQDQYRRRKEHEERRVRDAHPILGGLILALSDEPQHLTAWRQGAAGERAVARRLDQLVDKDVEVLHDRRIPGSRANIDHIAVSSSGVYVIDAKNYTGTVRVDRAGGLLGPRRYKLLVGRRDATELVAAVQRQVQLVRDALAGAPQISHAVAVTGVLAFVDADWPLFPPDRIEGVRLESPRSARRLILRRGPHTASDVKVIADRLHHHFPIHQPRPNTPG